MQPNGKLEARLGRYARVREPAAGIEGCMRERAAETGGGSVHVGQENLSQSCI